MVIARTARLCLLLLLLVSASSCGALIGRTGALRSDPQPLFFMGVCYDTVIMTDDMRHVEMVWPMRVLAALDLPLSFVMDVLLLPVDAVIWMTWTKDQTAETPDREVVPPTKVDGGDRTSGESR